MVSPAVQPLVAMLAHPLGGNPTQYVIEHAFAHHHLDWRYLSFDVPPEDLEDAVRGLRALGFRGAHCADPYKQAIVPFLDRTTDTAAAVGAVNLILRDGSTLIGENTEGKGAVDAIRAAVDPAGKQAIVLGAGCLARAVAVELAAAGIAGITIVDREETDAQRLAGLLSNGSQVPATAARWEGDYSVPPDAEILIHATIRSRSPKTAALPLAAESLRPELAVADTTAYGTETWLLGEARRRGCKTVDGLSIFLEQVAIAVRLWTGLDPTRSVLREAAEEFLEL